MFGLKFKFRIMVIFCNFNRCHCKKGEKCNLDKNCTKIRHYGIDGGTCLRGESDIFVH